MVRSGSQTVDAAGRFDWRLSSRGVLDEVLTGDAGRVIAG